MRVLLGLAALAATASSVSAADVTIQGGATNSMATYPPIGQTALASIFVTLPSGANVAVSPAGTVNTSPTAWENSNNFLLTIANNVNAVNFRFRTNIYTGQMQYRWAPGYSAGAAYTCDICTGGNTLTNCNTATGPGASPSPTLGYSCSGVDRTYVFANLTPSTQLQQIANSFSIQLFDINTNPAPNVSSYSFQVVRSAPAIVGDPQISGMQGQDFQVHGMPDEIFNMITYPNLQVNARFIYLSSAACHDNFTACFAHPGTYISEEGIRLGKDKIHVQAGSYKKGLTVSVNGNKVTEQTTKVKLGSVHVESHRRVVIKTPIMSIAISNSDKFLNQEVALYDQKLLALGAERRVLLVGDSFHPEVPLHGLQGQTWRNVEYPSGLDYEGSISDYHVTDGNLFGSKFVFNQYKQ